MKHHRGFPHCIFWGVTVNQFWISAARFKPKHNSKLNITVKNILLPIDRMRVQSFSSEHSVIVGTVGRAFEPRPRIHCEIFNANQWLNLSSGLSKSKPEIVSILSLLSLFTELHARPERNVLWKLNSNMVLVEVGERKQSCFSLDNFEVHNHIFLNYNVSSFCRRSCFFLRAFRKNPSEIPRGNILIPCQLFGFRSKVSSWTCFWVWSSDAWFYCRF